MVATLRKYQTVTERVKGLNLNELVDTMLKKLDTKTFTRDAFVNFTETLIGNVEQELEKWWKDQAMLVCFVIVRVGL